MVKPESKSAVLDGSQHGFVVLNGRLWLANGKIEENDLKTFFLDFFLAPQKSGKKIQRDEIMQEFFLRTKKFQINCPKLVIYRPLAW